MNHPTPKKTLNKIANIFTGTEKSCIMILVSVNSSSIAGTGRVGPRQKARVTYSAVSERDAPFFSDDQPRFFDDRNKAPISPYSQRKDQSFNKNGPKNDRQLKKDYKMSPRPQRQLSDFQPSRSGLESRLERVRSESQVHVDEMQVVNSADGSVNEIQVVSEPQHSQLNDENKVSEEAFCLLQDLNVVLDEVRNEDQVWKNPSEEEVQQEGEKFSELKINEIESSETKVAIQDPEIEKGQIVNDEVVIEKVVECSEINVDVVKSDELMVVNENDFGNEEKVEFNKIDVDVVKSEELVVVNENDLKNEEKGDFNKIDDDVVTTEELMVVSENDLKNEENVELNQIDFDVVKSKELMIESEVDLKNEEKVELNKIGVYVKSEELVIENEVYLKNEEPVESNEIGVDFEKEELVVIKEDDSKNEKSEESNVDVIKSEELIIVKEDGLKIEQEDDSKNEKSVESNVDVIQSEELIIVKEGGLKIEKDDCKVNIESSSEKENKIEEEKNETERIL